MRQFVFLLHDGALCRVEWSWQYALLASLGGFAGDFRCSL